MPGINLFLNFDRIKAYELFQIDVSHGGKMFKHLGLASLLLLSLSAFSNDKIVGGEELDSIEQAPFSVKFKKGCGGSVISKKWILSAAHCASIFEYGGYVGVLNYKDNKRIEFKVEKSIIHPEFSRTTLSNDFALIKVVGELPLNGINIKAVKLADKLFEDSQLQSPGTIATVYGWGKLGERANATEDLRYVEVPLVSNEIANESSAYDGKVTESMLAAGLIEGGKDACQGDSGGPMTVVGADGSQVLVGVVSWGRGCARANKYGIYSKVSYGNEWISKTMNDQ